MYCSMYLDYCEYKNVQYIFYLDYCEYKHVLYYVFRLL